MENKKKIKASNPIKIYFNTLYFFDFSLVTFIGGFFIFETLVCFRRVCLLAMNVICFINL